MDLTYTYDDAGHVTGIADGRQGQNATYSYDPLNRLLTATGPWGDLGSQYDAIGNRVWSAVNGTTTTYSYGPTTNRLSSLIRDGQQFEGFDDDGLGRLTQDSAVQAYTYTPASLLETAQTWAGALNTSRYDADGRRVLKIAGNETSRTYVVNELSEFSTEGGR